MAFLEVTKGATSQSIPIEIKDSSVTTGAGLTGLAFNTAGLTAYYWRAGGTATAITLATLAAVNSAYSSGGFKEVDATNMPGMYRLDVPDAAFASGANWVIIELKGATNMAQCRVFIELCGLDKQDSVRAGLTGLANATPGASGGLLIAGTNSGATTFSGGMTISSSSGNALTLTSSGGNGDALELNGNGSGSAIDANAGATGIGVDIAGGSTSGDGMKLGTTSGHGLFITPAGNGKHGFAITMGTANNASGIAITGSSGTGSCYGIVVVAGSNAANSAAALRLDGSVACPGISVSGGSTSGDGIVVTTTSGHGVTITAAGSSKHGITSTGGTSGNGMTLVAGSGGATLDSTTTAAIGTAVWATGTRVLTAGTNIVLAKGTGVTGFNDIAATDVWNVAVPGTFIAGTAGYVLGTNLNATVSSRGTDTGVWAAATRTLTSGANIVLAKGTGVTGFNDIAATDVWAATTRTLSAGTNIVLAKGTGVTGFNDLATSDIDARLAAIGLDHLVQVAVTGTDITDNSIIAKLVSKSATADWDTYNNTTDSHEALRDRGDAAWITATGFSTHTAADVWAVGTRVLTAGTNIALAKGTGVTGFNDPTTAAIADAVWDEAISGHLTAGTTGAALNAAGSAGDPWSTPLPGAYGAGTAGYIVGTNLNATVSSRGTDTGVWAAATRTLTSGANIALAKGTGVTGFNDIAATDVWAAATRTLSAGTNIVLAKGTGVTGFNDLSAAQVNTEVDTALADIHLDHLIGVADPGSIVANNSLLAKLVSKSATAAFTSYNNTTDSLEALRDRGDAAWITATGFSTHTAADIWSVGTRTLTSGANIALAKGTGVTGFNDLATSDIDARLAAIGLDHLVQVAVTGTDITDNSIIAKLVSKSATADWDTYNNTTDSHEALRDRGDAAWITATGFSTHTAADVWAVGTRVLTAGTNIVLAKGTGVTGFNDISATDVWSSVTRTLTSGANIVLVKGTGVTGFNDLATSDIDARLAAIGLDHLVQVAVTGTDITDNSIIAKLVSKSATADWDSFDNTTDSHEALRDNLATATALAAAKTVCDSMLAIVGTTGVAIASATQQAIADTLLTRNVSNVESTAAEHTLCTVILASLEMAISGTTMTIKRTDGATTHVTKTVTKVTSDDPIRGVG